MNEEESLRAVAKLKEKTMVQRGSLVVSEVGVSAVWTAKAMSVVFARKTWRGKRSAEIHENREGSVFAELKQDTGVDIESAADYYQELLFVLPANLLI